VAAEGLIPKNFVSKHREGGSCSGAAKNICEHNEAADGNDFEFTVPLLLDYEAPAHINMFAAFAKTILFRESYCGFEVFVANGRMGLEKSQLVCEFAQKDCFLRRAGECDYFAFCDIERREWCFGTTPGNRAVIASLQP